MLIPKEIFYYNLPIKDKVEIEWGHWIEASKAEYDIKVNYITDMKEFKKDNFNFIILDWHRLLDDKYIQEVGINDVLNKELIYLINTDVIKLIIDYTCEGESHDYFFKFIDRMIKKGKIKSSNIYFIANDNKLEESYDTWTEKYDVPKINIITANKHLTISRGWIMDKKRFPIEDFKVDKIREKKFTCLNGVFKSWRLLLVTELFKRGLDKDGYISLIGNYGCDILDHFSLEGVVTDKSSITENKIFEKYLEELNLYYKEEVYPKLPIITELDKGTTFGKSIVDFYKNNRVDIDNWNRKISPYLTSSYVHEMYTNSYFNIVTETAYNWDISSILGNSVYLSEKTLKPMFGMQPFIVVTNSGYLDFLRELGFKTFPEFFDESYDEIENPLERMNIIVNEIQKICSLSYEEIHDKYYSIFDKLEHNRNRLLEISDDKKIVHGNYSDIFDWGRRNKGFETVVYEK
jgi:hypothetical protein